MFDRRKLAALLWLCVVSPWLTACGRGDEEAKQLLGRINRMRDAPLAEREPYIRAVAEMKPEADDARKAKEKCLQAYQQLQAAHDETERAAAQLAEMKAAGRKPRYEEIAAADRATTMMLKAKKAEPACAEAVATLRRRLR